MCRLKAQGRENKKTVKKEEEHEDAMLPHGNIDCFQLVVTGGRSLCVLLPGNAYIFLSFSEIGKSNKRQSHTRLDIISLSHQVSSCRLKMLKFRSNQRSRCSSSDEPA